jgi:hypothetical protein
VGTLPRRDLDIFPWRVMGGRFKGRLRACLMLLGEPDEDEDSRPIGVK